MQVILHTGAHCTDGGRLLECLFKNKDLCLDHGTVVPKLGGYRRLLRQSLLTTQHDALNENAREELLNAMLGEERPDRVILSYSDFFGAPRSAVRNGILYPNAVDRLANFRDLFPDDELELFMGLRDMAGFLPCVFERSPKSQMLGFLGGVDPREMRWSETVRQIREQVPSIRITLWCNEDTPLIWSEIIREMIGASVTDQIDGAYDLLTEIMSEEGMRRFEAYLTAHPVMTERQRRRVIAAFLDKFAVESQIEEELDVPGWTQAFVGELAEIYDDDAIELGRMDGVRLLTP